MLHRNVRDTRDTREHIHERKSRRALMVVGLHSSRPRLSASSNDVAAFWSPLFSILLYLVTSWCTSAKAAAFASAPAFLSFFAGLTGC